MDRFTVEHWTRERRTLDRFRDITQMNKEYAAFCKVNCFDCTFRDLHHTFATMMIAGGTDVRTVASYVNRFSMSMT